jgi:hypothetical protein
VPASLTTSAEGAEAFSVVLQAKELVNTSTQLFRDLGFIAQSQMVSASSGTGAGTCADYGSYDYSRTYNGTTGAYNVTFTFNLCRQNDFQYNGSFSARGTQASLTGQLSSGLTMLNFQNNYTTLIGSIVGASLTFQMDGTGDASNGSYIITMNGGMSSYDYYTLGRHVLAYTNLVSEITSTTAAGVQDSLMTVSGAYQERTQTKTVDVTYTNFTVVTTSDLVAGRDDMDIQGGISVNFTPDAGMEGLFNVATAIPVRTDWSSYPPVTTQGTLVTNGTATAQYGAADTIDVSVGVGPPVSYAKEFMLLKVQDFYAMEQQLPIVSGATGSASGSIMSISALSNSSSPADLSCYTDVHVSYHNVTAPTPPAATPFWFVHWNSGLSTCIPQSSIPFEEATSSTGVATDPCDVGLDINGAAMDITSGGVEHFLAAAMPTGYYILSIDNYSCDWTVVGNAATVLVGDYLFGPYTCAYTASDGDGSTPGAWCRLADIRVNGDATIDVLAPDVALNPWH